jgi:hypothetical protein
MQGNRFEVAIEASGHQLGLSFDARAELLSELT